MESKLQIHPNALPGLSDSLMASGMIVNLERTVGRPIRFNSSRGGFSAIIEGVEVNERGHILLKISPQVQSLESDLVPELPILARLRQNGRYESNWHSFCLSSEKTGLEDLQGQVRIFW